MGKKSYKIWLLICGIFLMPLSSLYAQCQGIDISISSQNTCVPAIFQFHADSVPAGATISWSINQNVVGSGTSLNYTFSNPGTYTVALIVTPQGSAACPPVTKTVTVYSQPQISYQVTSQSAFCSPPATLQMSASTPGGIAQAAWIVGNQNGNGENVSINFNTPGWKQLTLHVIDSNGCTGTIQDSVFVNIVPPITGNFTVNPANGFGCAPQTFQIQGNINKPQGYAIDSAIITFPGSNINRRKINGPITNNTISRNVNINTPGTYNVAFTVYAGGCVFTLSGNVTTLQVEPSPTVGIAPLSNIANDTVCTKQRLVFLNTTPNRNTFPGTYTWLTPGGGVRRHTANDSILEVSFLTPGTFNISLAYIGACGDTAIMNQAVTVLGPRARISNQSTNTGCNVPHTVDFIDNSILLAQGTNTYFWRVYDTLGNPMDSSTLQNPSFLFNHTGVYPVMMVVHNSFTGCSDTLFNTRMVVIGAPLAEIDSIPPLPKCAPSAFQVNLFNKTQHTQGFTYQWTVFDQNGNQVDNRTGQNANLQIPIPGVYDLRMIVRNGPTCADTLYKSNYLTVNGVHGSIDVSGPPACLSTSGYSRTFDITPISAHPANAYAGASYSWRAIPDTGVTITNANSAQAQFNFSVPGCYTIQCTVITAQNCERIITSDSLCIGVKANFELPKTRLCLNGMMPTINHTKDYHDTAMSYQWFSVPAGASFFPNNTADTPQVSFGAMGNYQVGLVASNANGCVDTMLQNVEVIDFDGNIWASNTYVQCGPYPITIRYNAPDAVRFDWEVNGFGAPNVRFSTDAPIDSILWFVYSGGYWFTVTAHTIDGCSITDSIRVVSGGPRPRFYPTSPTSGCDPLTVSFLDSTNTVDSLIFFPANGDPFQTLANYPIGNNYQLTYTFPYHNKHIDSVVYEPTMVARKSTCTSPVIQKHEIVVYARPDIGYHIPQDSGCAPFAFEYFDSSYHAPAGSWFVLDYGDGNRDSLSTRHFQHTYTQPGTYNLHITVYNVYGCVADSAITTQVHVLDPPTAAFHADDRKQCFDVNQFAFFDSSYVPAHTPHLHYTWHFGNGDTSHAQNPVYTYPAPGVYDVSLSVSTVFGCVDSIHLPGYITVLDTVPPPAPNLTYLTVNADNTVEINWQASTYSPFGFYTLFENPGGGQNFPIFSDSTLAMIQYTDSNAMPQIAPAGYALSQTDSCGIESEHSLTHRTVHLQLTGTAMATVSLQWTPYVGWNQILGYEVNYREVDSTQWQNFALTGDTQIAVSGLCDKDYEFMITAISDGSHPYRSNSNRVTDKPLYNFPNTAPEVNFVTVSGPDRIDLSWEPNNWVQFDKFIIDRKQGNGFWDFNYATSTTPSFSDSLVETDRYTYSYVLRMIDKCNYITEGSPSSTTILLKAEPIQDSGMKLHWSPYEGWATGVYKYRIYRDDNGKGYTMLTEVDGHTRKYYDTDVPKEGDGGVCYVVEAFSWDGENTSKSNEICGYFPERVFIPSAFSPNGDGVNDEFYIAGISFKTIEMKVFDRWGNLVFETNQVPARWDGRVLNGSRANQGVYVYFIDGVGQNGYRVKKNGTITVIY